MVGEREKNVVGFKDKKQYDSSPFKKQENSGKKREVQLVCTNYSAD